MVDDIHSFCSIVAHSFQAFERVVSVALSHHCAIIILIGACNTGVI